MTSTFRGTAPRVVARWPDERTTPSCSARGQRLEVRGMLRPMHGEFAIEFGNDGPHAVVFRVRTDHARETVEGHLVEVGQRVTASWPIAADHRYDLVARGPGGCVHEFRGSMAPGLAQMYEVHLAPEPDVQGHQVFGIANFGSAPGTVRITDLLRGTAEDVTVSPDDVVEWRAPCAWRGDRYDYAMSSLDVGNFRWRFTGHLARGPQASNCLGRRAVG